MAKLVYLHIPKSGGTSQRTLFFDLYGRKNVMWHGARQPALPRNIPAYDDHALSDYAVIGGHKPIAYYPENLDAFYISVVREPISRVISLYSYYTKPQFADDYHKSAREEALENWKKLGIDTESLVNSINNCERFREEIENYQCYYLSRHENTFDGAVSTLGHSKAIVCDMDSTPRMNTILSDLFGWGPVPQRKLNRSKEKTHESFFNEPGLVETVSELVAEDLRLYEFISKEHQGVFSNIGENSKLPHSLKALTPFTEREENVPPWTQVHVYTKGFVSISSEGTGTTGIVIINYSALQLDLERFPELSIYYTLHDIEGRQIAPDVFRCRLDVPVPANGKSSWNLEVEVPAQYREAASFIQVGLSIEKSKDFAQHNPLHVCSAYIIPPSGD